RNRDQTKKPERFVVITSTLAVAGLVPSNVTDEGVTMQEAPVGMPEQVNVTTLLKPPLGVIVTVKLADCPALIVFPVGLSESVKSAVFPEGGATDCKVCTRSRRPLPMPLPTGTACATPAAALPSFVVGSRFSKRAPAPETKGALKEVPHPAA